MIRVLIVEDSMTLRTLLRTILESDPDIRVIGEAGTGEEAIRMTGTLRPDLITMDVHMPGIDGLEATKEIMAHYPTPIIIVSSSSSGSEVETSLNAMRAGALTVIRKPDNPSALEFQAQQGHFLSMVKALSQVKVVRRTAQRIAVRGQRTPRATPISRVRLIVIAASTGGPAAVARVLGELPSGFRVPVLVVQHIAAGFAHGLADWLNANCRVPVRLATSGTLAAAGTVYLAPDNRQLGIMPDGRLVVSEAPMIGGFRPSATYLFESAAQSYGGGVVAVVLTGMGSDGVAALPALHTAGAHIIAQDEATSVVYGMPREAAMSGLVDAVLPIGEIGESLVALTEGYSR